MFDTQKKKSMDQRVYQQVQLSSSENLHVGSNEKIPRREQ